MLAHDTLFSWKGNGGGIGNWQSKCHLAIYVKTGLPDLIIVSDLGADSGTSITNSSENLATLIINKFDLNHDNFTWIERYDSEASVVTFDKLGMSFIKTKWRHIPLPQVNDLIEQYI
jgi:hypothetical protein